MRHGCGLDCDLCGVVRPGRSGRRARSCRHLSPPAGERGLGAPWSPNAENRGRYLPVRVTFIETDGATARAGKFGTAGRAAEHYPQKQNGGRKLRNRHIAARDPRCAYPVRRGSCFVLRRRGQHPGGPHLRKFGQTLEQFPRARIGLATHRTASLENNRCCPCLL
jgi:hypothetical protein